MWLKFTRDFSWKPTSQSTIVYKEGSVINAKAEVAEAALAKNAAIKMSKKNKDDIPTEEAEGGEE